VGERGGTGGQKSSWTSTTTRAGSKVVGDAIVCGRGRVDGGVFGGVDVTRGRY
jgi:hypothetical protein